MVANCANKQPKVNTLVIQYKVNRNQTAAIAELLAAGVIDLIGCGLIFYTGLNLALSLVQLINMETGESKSTEEGYSLCTSRVYFGHRVTPIHSLSG